MAVNTGDTISATDFNSIQSRIEQLLGVGTGDFGYGQAVNSSQVIPLSDKTIPNGNSVTQDQIQNLLDDFNAVYKHQEGEGIDINDYSQGDIIGADFSGTDISYSGEVITVQNQDTTKGINDFYAEIDELETNRLKIAANQQQIDTVLSDTRQRDWNDQIVTEFTVSFSNVDKRRNFFNAGGEVRIEGTLDLGTSSNLSLQRDSNWKDMLENVGILKFNYNSTVDTGGASGTSFPDGAIGNQDLTENFQTIFRKDANSGDYSNSFWTIEAREDNNTTLRFRITLIDNGPEDAAVGTGSVPGGIQEPVEADITFTYSYLKSADAVVVDTPAFNTVNLFDPDKTSEPFIQTPNNDSPSNNEVVYTNTGVKLQGSEFVVLNGSDTHIRTQWYVERLTDGDRTLYDETGPDESYTVGSNLFDDVRGDNFAYRWQVRYEGETLGWTPWSDPATFVTSSFAGINAILNNTQEFTLEEELRDNWGWDTNQKVQGTVRIPSNVTISSSNVDIPAFQVSSLPSGSQISIENSGRILGKGGNGGYIVFPNIIRDGQDGGIALEVSNPVNVTNFGNISGGGGGGGAAIINDRNKFEIFSAGGGGGVGSNSAGGVAPQGDSGTSGTLFSSGSGGFESGTFTVDPEGPGARPGGELDPSDDPNTTSPTQSEPPGTGNTYTASGIVIGGSGGGYGQSGQRGSASTSGLKFPASIEETVSNGGTRGFAIIGESNINWQGGQANVQGRILQ